VDQGRPADEVELAIVDPLTGRHGGEIWVAGPNVAVGYLGRPDVSERTFCARLRTGDAGFVHVGGSHVADVPVVV
jgi:acyl-CoA synthetase (AMP-forming)/AMP-acid ligase II